MPIYFKSVVFSVVSALIFLVSTAAMSQNAAESLAGTKNSSHEFWIDRKIGDTTSRLFFYNYTRYRVNYETSDLNEVMSFNSIYYNVYGGWSISLGATFEPSYFTPNLGINYYYENASKSFAFNGFLSRDIADQSIATNNLFFFVQYRPKIAGNWYMYSQILHDGIYSFDKHLYSDQLCRLGLDYKRFIQFGLSYDLAYYQDAALDWQTYTNPGLFVRVQFAD